MLKLICTLIMVTGFSFIIDVCQHDWFDKEPVEVKSTPIYIKMPIKNEDA